MAPKPYKSVCISLYEDDIARADEYVRELKKRGYVTMNRSRLIRHALRQLAIDDIQIPEQI